MAIKLYGHIAIWPYSMAIARPPPGTKKWPYLDAMKASEALDWTIRYRISCSTSRKQSQGLIRPI